MFNQMKVKMLATVCILFSLMKNPVSSSLSEKLPINGLKTTSNAELSLNGQIAEESTEHDVHSEDNTLTDTLPYYDSYNNDERSFDGEQRQSLKALKEQPDDYHENKRQFKFGKKSGNPAAAGQGRAYEAEKKMFKFGEKSKIDELNLDTLNKKAFKFGKKSLIDESISNPESLKTKKAFKFGKRVEKLPEYRAAAYQKRSFKFGKRNFDESSEEWLGAQDKRKFQFGKRLPLNLERKTAFKFGKRFPDSNLEEEKRAFKFGKRGSESTKHSF